jgi:ketosteroid isomerase-like protein
MVRRALMLVVPWLLVTLSFARIGSPNASSASGLSGLPDKKLMQQIMDAWATMDPAAAAKYYDQSPEDTFFDDAGAVKFVGWKAYEDGIRKVLTSEQSTKWTVNDDAVVHRAGNYAWGTATVHTEYVFKNGTRQVMDERWTLIWIEKGGKWLVVHEHFSAPPADTPR